MELFGMLQLVVQIVPLWLLKLIVSEHSSCRIY